jgi:hypothetical protein
MILGVSVFPLQVMISTLPHIWKTPMLTAIINLFLFANYFLKITAILFLFPGKEIGKINV